MKESITLKNNTENGVPMEATFAPNQGMNLLSFKKGNIEAIDQTTMPLFLERYAGLGALIGPHFHHRPKEALIQKFDESLFPHIAKQKANEVQEPFTHGIARYVPWKYEYSETQISARLRGKDIYKGVLIKDFEGQDFEMTLDVKLIHDGLILQFNIHSELPSVIGFHYYYNYIPSSYVQAFVHEDYKTQETWKQLPSAWYDKIKNKLHFDASQEADFGFKPIEQTDHPYHLISLKGSTHLLHVEYISSNEKETSWQLYHPKEASFVCIEPLSALNPRKPILKNSNLQLKISLF
jgi:hypothetical protein